MNLALQQAGFPLVRDTAKVPDSKLDAFVAANPELQLNADAIRAGDAKTMVSAADLVKQKLLTQSEAESLGVSSEQAVYSIPNAGAFKMVADPAQVNWVLTIAIPDYPRHLRDDGIWPDCSNPRRDVPNPHPL